MPPPTFELSSVSGRGSSASSSSLKRAPMWKNAAWAIVLERFLPGVVRAPLHHDIRRFQGHPAVIENQDEFALDHDHIVQGARPMHDGALAAVLEPIDIQDPQQVTRRHRGR